MSMQVLIVDDVRVNAHVLARLVSTVPDTATKLFTCPDEALAWAYRHDVDLAIVDYHMPSMTGADFVAAFRGIRRNRHTPVVIVTGERAREVRHECLRAGATDFLCKPIDHVEVTARVTNLLALRRAQLDLQDHATWLTREVDKATRELVLREEELIRRLTLAAECHDSATGQHIERMAEYCYVTSDAMGFEELASVKLRKAAPMHDIGKIGLPDTLLKKTDRLDPDEIALMRKHTLFGYEILAGSSSTLIQLAAEIALSHHERFDGTGYPHGLAGGDIALPARIVAVADVFDALTSERSYKRSWPVEDAFDFLRQERGRQFDPSCVDAFLSRREDILPLVEVGAALGYAS
jgi:response regulator RpfG family c-di-GMP phosphodiesterase